MSALNYAKSGVDRKLADRFIEKISLLSQSTLNRKVQSTIGGYASLFALDRKRWIAASTDGVGTKLKLAFEFNQHETIGIDLVAMSVNDLLCVGAEPLFFLDYFATGRLNLGVGEEVLAGIVEGCKLARCALVGGETAEMPDFYSPGEYDLAGFAVGIVSPSEVLPKKGVRPGDSLIGIKSSGCHSNGYSLLRKILPSGKQRKTIAKELLTPTRIYVNSLIPLIKKGWIKGLAHITGSGFLNVPRISDQVSYEIQLPASGERPQIFEWIQDQANLSLKELTQTFNLGIGMVLVTSPDKVNLVMKQLKLLGEDAWNIGEVKSLRSRQGSEVYLRYQKSSVILNYQ